MIANVVYAMSNCDEEDCSDCGDADGQDSDSVSEDAKNWQSMRLKLGGSL